MNEPAVHIAPIIVTQNIFRYEAYLQIRNGTTNSGTH